MNFVLEPLVRILPLWLRKEIVAEQLAQTSELRLRTGQAVEMVCLTGSYWLRQKVTEEDLKFCINMASKYSPWTASTMNEGFITIEGGHRIGISCCWMLEESGRCSIQKMTSLCIRIAKDFGSISGDLCLLHESILILGRPGSGKTTLLRDLVREISNHRKGSICVVDERKEVFPMNGNTMCFYPGPRTDVLSGYPKGKGIEMAIRCLSPKVVAIDEITAAEDCAALIEAGWCGVDILATAHASSVDDLFKRPVYKPLLECGLFRICVVMNEDKSWNLERIKR
jgi:stage III sporulation protein AA